MPQPKSTTFNYALAGQMGDHIIDQFQKPIDLAEFFVMAGFDVAGGVITPISARNGQGWFSGIKYRLARLCPLRSRWLLFARRRGGDFQSAFAVHAGGVIGLGGENMAVGEDLPKQPAGLGERLVRRQVFVRFLPIDRAAHW